MKRVLTQSMKFTAAAQLQDAFVSAIQECIRWVEKLNKQLTMISVVTGKTAGEMDKVYDNVVEGAKKLRVAASDYAEASLIFYQQGLDDGEVQRRTDITIKAAQAAGQSTQEMSKQLTAIWNTYQMAGDEMQRAASVGAKLAADTAVDFKDIAEGMQISATAAAQMGVSYDSLAAIIATVGDTTQQSASVIGNAYKTIFSRFQQLKVEGTDGEVTLNRVSSQLQSMGIQVLDSSGNLRELDDVIMEVGLSWDKYSEKQQLAIAEIVGGTRQYGQFLALMQNFDKYLNLLNVAQDEDGSELESQYAAVQESVEMAALNAGEAWNRAFGEVIDDEMIKDFYNALEEVGKIVESILQGLGGFEGILTLVGTLLSKNIIPKLDQAVLAMKTLKANSTIEGRQAQVEASGKEMQNVLKQTTAEKMSKATTDRQRYQINFSADNAGFKIDTWTQIGKAQQQVNAMINSGNDSLKIQGQYLAEQLKTYGELINKGSDALEIARQELQVEKETTQELINQIRETNQPVQDTSVTEKIAANEDRLSDIQVEKEIYNEGFDSATSSEDLQFYMDQVLALEREEEIITRINEKLAEKNRILAQNEAGALEVKNAFLNIAEAVSKATITADGIIDKKTVDELRAQVGRGLKNAGVGKELRKSIQADLGELAKSGELTKTTESIRAKLEQALNGKKIDTSSYNSIIKALDQIEQGTNGVSAITNNLSKQLDGLKISATQVTSSLTQISFGITGIATAVSSGWSAALEGNILGVVSAMASIGMQLPTLLSGISTLKTAFQGLSAVTKLNAIANETFAASTTTVTGAQIALSAAEKEQLIHQQLLQMANAAGIANAEGMATADLSAALAKKGLSISIDQNTGAVVANTVAWMSNPIGWIVAAIMAVVAAFTIWNKIIEINTKNAEKEVEKCQEEVDKYKELSDAIDQNTKAVEDNIAAYQKAQATGENVVETYDNMVDSLTNLNESLIEAGANSADLSQAMTTALATGDMTQYYEEVSKAQTQIYKEQMENYEDLNKAQIKLAKNQMTKAFDFNGPQKTTVATTSSSQYGTTAPSQALRDAAKNSDLLSDNGTTVTLNLEFDNVTEFREQYQELVRIKEELEDTGAAQSEINVIDQQIEGLTETYNNLEESINEATSAMQNMMASSIQNSGYDFGGVDLNNQIGYIQQVYNEMRAQGEAIGLTNEEIEASFRNVIATVPELNTALASLNQVDQIMQNVMKSGKDFSFNTEGSQKEIQDLQKDIDNLEAKLEEGKGKTGIGKWFNGKSAEEEFIEGTLGKTKEEAEAELEELRQSMLEKQEQIKQDIQNAFNDMSLEDREMLLKVGVDFVDDKEDLQQMLDNIENLKLKVNIEFKNEDELRAQFDEDQTTQDNMGGAIQEYQDNGFVTVDTAKEMIDNGMGEYLMIVNDQFVLTTGAAEAYNASIERQKDNVQELLGLTTELRAPTEEFATSMAALRATMDNTVLEEYAQGLEDISVKFLNSEGSAQDMITFFNDLDTQISDSITNIKNEMSNLSDEQIFQVLKSFESLGVNLADTMAKANAAAAQGQMTIGEYRDALFAAGEAQKSAAEGAKDIANENLTRTIQETNEALGLEGENYIDNAKGLKDYISEKKKNVKQNSQEQRQLEETEALLNDAEGAYEDVTKSLEDYDEAMSDMEALEGFTDTVTENYEALQGILNDDFSLKFNMEDLDTSQLDVLQTTIQSALDSTAKLSEEAATRVAQAMIDTTNGMNSVIINGQTYTRDALVNALKQGQISAQDIMKTGNAAATALLQQVATENETAITSTSQAIGTLMTAVSNLIKDFQAKITVTISDSTLDLTPSWGGPLELGWKLLKGEKVSISPSGSLTFDIKGGLTGDSAANFSSALDSAAAFFNSNDAGGMTDGIPSLGDYSTQTPTVANPNAFKSEDGVPKKSGGGGSQKEFEPEEMLDEDDAEKYHERYENLLESLERLTDQLDEYESAADDAFGAAKYRALQKYEKQLLKIGLTQKKLVAETQKYYKQDKQDFLNLSPQIAALAKWSDSSDYATLLNPEQIRLYLEQQAEAALQAYNNAIAQYNAAGDSSDAAKAALDQAKSLYDATIENLGKQEEALNQLLDTEDLLRERINEQVENIREWMSAKVEKYTYKMELQISIDELDIEWMDHLIEQWGDLGVKTGKTWDWLKNQITATGSSLEATIENMNDMQSILDNMGSGEYDDEFIATFGQEAYDKYIEGNGRIPAEVIEQMEDNASNMISYLDEMYDKADEMLSQYVEILEVYMDEFDKIATKLEQQNDRLDMYQELLDFSGQKYTPEGRQAVKQIADARVDNASVEVERAAAQLEVAKKAAEDTQKQLQDFYDTYGTDAENYSTAEAFTYNKLKEAAENAEDILNDAQGDMTSAIQDLASAAADAIEQVAEVIKQEVVDNLNGDFADFESMTEMYDQQYQLDHFFLEDYDKGYQLNELLKKVQDSMSQITDPDQLKEYQGLLDEINASLEEGVDVTQTDVDLLNAKFELQQAMDAYEEAQAQKNSMRLARDASGNWSYVYSQDESQVEDAASRLAEAQYNYQKLLHDARDESEQLWIQMQQEFFEFQESIDWSRMAFDEKYKSQIMQQYDYYQRMTGLYSDQIIKYNNMLGDDFSETTLGIVTNYDTMEGAQAEYTEQHKVYHSQLESNTEHYQSIVEQVCNKVGIDYGNLSDEIANETAEMKSKNDELRKNITDLKDSAIDDLTAINDKIGPWSRDFIYSMNKAEESVRSLIQALQDLKRAQMAEIENSEDEEFIETPTDEGEGVTQAPTEPPKDNGLEKAAAAYENAMEIYHKINRGLYPTGSQNRLSKALSEGYTETEYRIAQDLINKVYPVSKRGQGIAWDTAVAQIKSKYGFKTGGLADFTGPAWLDGTKSKPELVLNPGDTQNILSAVQIMRETVAQRISALNNKIIPLPSVISERNGSQEIKQQVQIDASFPNVSVAAEIEEALNSLINQVAQYNIK